MTERRRHLLHTLPCGLPGIQYGSTRAKPSRLERKRDRRAVTVVQTLSGAQIARADGGIDGHLGHLRATLVPQIVREATLGNVADPLLGLALLSGALTGLHAAWLACDTLLCLAYHDVKELGFIASFQRRSFSTGFLRGSAGYLQ